MQNRIKTILLILGCSVGCGLQGFESGDVFSEYDQHDQLQNQLDARQLQEQQQLQDRQLTERAEFNSRYQGRDAADISDTDRKADKDLLAKHTREWEELNTRQALENTHLRTVSKSVTRNILDWLQDYFYHSGDLANAKNIINSGLMDRRLAANGQKTGDWFADKIKLKDALKDLTPTQRLSVINDYIKRTGLRFDNKIPDALVQTLNEMLPDGEKLRYVRKEGRIVQSPKKNNVALSTFANSFLID